MSTAPPLEHCDAAAKAKEAVEELDGSVSPSAHVPQMPFALAIFLSAFLLFQVQLLLGKQILPMFGGAPAVWTACLLVFQLLLLAGYGLAHGLALGLGIRSQAAVQFALLTASLVLLAVLSRTWPSPITPGSDWRPTGEAHPTFSIVCFLFAAIGLPFLLLSTTSPLLQNWFARSSPGASPYRLYALSNAGSLLGLLSYPVLVEPNLRVRTQAWVWTVGYAAWAVTFICCALMMRRTFPLTQINERSNEAGGQKSRPGWKAAAQWTGLAACASVLLLATTNFICQEVAVIPFLWVLPLCLYLLSFILCFESDRWYRRGLFHAFFAVAAGAMILVTQPNVEYSYLVQLAACLALLFAGCMVCHGEAARTRPHTKHLTQFYLCISAGGALGGIFVGLVAPRIFLNYWEYPLGILACAVVILGAAVGHRNSWWYRGSALLAVLILTGAAFVLPGVLAPLVPGLRLALWERGLLPGALLALAGFLMVRKRATSQTNPQAWPMRFAARVCLGVLTAGLAIPQKAEFFHVIARARNFYGVLSVVDVQPENYLALRHGKIVHGFQFQDAQRARVATGYYGENSPANIVIQNWPVHPMRVGLVGMGAGALAAIGKPRDVYRFYEINPDVYLFSSGEQPHFTFLRDSPAKVEVALGDARILLEQEAAKKEPQGFDVLVLDAFSSDAIPMHLLTREAFDVYLKLLRGPESVVAVHISNRTLDLGPVVAGLANEFGMKAVRCQPVSLKSYLWPSDWILLSKSGASLSIPELRKWEVPVSGSAKPILWTDDYSNLWRVLR